MAVTGLRYIVVEGPIGAGKTTLARRLARELQAHALLEAPEENPFLERFYHEPRRYALPAQLCFLLQRARQVELVRQGDLFESLQVADFLFEKDRIFAMLNLDAHELDLYDQIYRRLAWDAPVPDCVIYLHAPLDVLAQRVRLRSRPEERELQPVYLQKVAEIYSDFFSRYRAAPLIVADSDRLDLVHEPGDFDLLLDALSSRNPGVTHL
jgi:deoxyguanosine kinase